MHTFDFKVDNALFECFESSDIKGGACDVQVALTRSESLLDLKVEISGRVTVVCDRCLEDCEVPVDYDGRLLVRVSDTQGEYDGEVMWIHPSDDMLDLAQYIYESIVLSLPYQRVHPEGGCDPDMMERFRVVSADELTRLEAEAQAEEASSVSDEARGRLSALKRRLEQNPTQKKE